MRRWQAMKRQRQRRAAPEGRKSRAEAERARRQRPATIFDGARCPAGQSKPLSQAPRPSITTAAASGAWSRSKTPLPERLCDRPGCYEPPRDSRRAPSAYCGDACGACVRRVSDRDGLSFYSEATIAVRLRMSEAAVVRARDELVATDLVAYRAPLVQVFSLPHAGVESRRGGLVQFGELLRTLAASSPQADPRRSP